MIKILFRKNQLILIFASLFPVTFLSAQNAPSIEWQKSFGGFSDDEGSFVRQTTDGGFIVAGESYSNDNDVSGNHGSGDYWIVKTDASGNLTWQKTYGGTSSDIASCIQQTTDGGFVIAGFSKSNDDDVTNHHGTTSYNDYWVVKIDSLGNIQWQNSLGGTLNDYASVIRQSHDGGYLVAGESYSNSGDVTGHHGGTALPDYWVAKLDSSGTLLWQKSLGGSGTDAANDIIENADGTIMVSGATTSNDGDVSNNHGNYDYWIVKLDASANIIWKKCYGGTGDDEATSIVNASDGGYVVGGWSASTGGDVTGNHGSDDFWVIKIDSLGVLVWQKSLGGSSYDFSYSMSTTSDGGVVAIGITESLNGDVTGYHGGVYFGDVWLVKLDGSGNEQWEKCFGGSNDEFGASVQETSDGGLIVAGWSESIDGDVTGNHGVADIWVLRLSVPTQVNDMSDLQSSLFIFPNPASNQLQLEFQNDLSGDAEITITNLLGEKVLEKNFIANGRKLEEEISLDENFSSGMYLLKVNCNGQQLEKSFVIARQ